MINKKLKIIFSLLLTMVLVLGPVFISAQKGLELEYPKFPEVPELTEETSLSDYVAYIFNFIIFASGFILFGVLVYGGILYLISAGDPNRRKSAKDRILGGFIGVFIIFSSYVIITTINPGFVIVHITKEGIQLTEPGETPTPTPTEEEKQVYNQFQVPSGKIVERLVLDDKAKEFLGTEEDAQVRPEGADYPDTVIGQLAKARDLSMQLLELSLALKALTDSFQCGKTECPCEKALIRVLCDLQLEYSDCDCGTGREDCKCDPDRINSHYYGKGDEFDQATAELRKLEEMVTQKSKELLDHQKEIRKKQLALIEKLLELRQPAFLMSVVETSGESDIDVYDYKTMRTLEHFLKAEEKEVKTFSFLDWLIPADPDDPASFPSLFMDLRAGFESRKENPPTFDPTTLYFKKDKKTDVFIEKAKRIDFDSLRNTIENALGTSPDSEVTGSVEDILKGIINQAISR